MKIKLFLFCFALATLLKCVQMYKTKDVVFSEDSFDVYYNKFKEEAKKHNRQYHTGISFVSFSNMLPPGTVGTCTTNGIFRLILISRAHWKVLSEEEKAGVMFHEMGHCFLDRDHLDKLTNINYYYSYRCPVSLMYPEVYFSNCLFDNWEYYMVELFNNK